MSMSHAEFFLPVGPEERLFAYTINMLAPYENAPFNLERSLVQEGSVPNLSQLNVGTCPKGFI